jgi:hypothetical protein
VAPTGSFEAAAYDEPALTPLLDRRDGADADGATQVGRRLSPQPEDDDGLGDEDAAEADASALDEDEPSRLGSPLPSPQADGQPGSSAAQGRLREREGPTSRDGPSPPLHELEPYAVDLGTRSAVKRALAERNAHKDLALKHSSPSRQAARGNNSARSARSPGGGSGVGGARPGSPPSPFSFEGGALNRPARTSSPVRQALFTSPLRFSRAGAEGTLPRAERTRRSASRFPERTPAASAEAAPLSCGLTDSATPNRRSLQNSLGRRARVGISPL